MTEVVTTGSVQGGRLEIRNKKRFLGDVGRMRDGEVLITVTRTRATRSTQSNRYYWGVVVQLLAEHTGYTPDEIHEILKAKFIPKRLSVANGNGEIVGEFVLGGTTTAMDKIEFGEFITAIREWAAEELSVVIPDPDTGRLWQQPRKEVA